MTKILKIIISSLVYLPISAYAGDLNNKWFMGADGEFIWYSYYGVPAVSFFGGYRWTNAGVEVGYTKPADEKHYFGSNDEPWLVYNSQNIYLDSLGFYNLSDKFELKGRLGVGYFITKAAELNSYNTWTDRAWGVRVGFGIQYKLSERVRTGVGYVFQSNHNILLGCLNSVSLNITYYAVKAAKK